MIDVDEIEADRGMPDQDLPCAGLSRIGVLIGQDLRTAIGVDTDRFGHFQPLGSACSGIRLPGIGLAPRFGKNCMIPPMQAR